jgi:hypothetical protein
LKVWSEKRDELAPRPTHSSPGIFDFAQGLLTGTPMASAAPTDSMDEDELLAELEGAAGSSDISVPQQAA